MLAAGLEGEGLADEPPHREVEEDAAGNIEYKQIHPEAGPPLSSAGSGLPPYSYDSSLSPALDCNGGISSKTWRVGRKEGIGLKRSLRDLSSPITSALSGPRFGNWLATGRRRVVRLPSLAFGSAVPAAWRKLDIPSGSTASHATKSRATRVRSAIGRSICGGTTRRQPGSPLISASTAFAQTRNSPRDRIVSADRICGINWRRSNAVGRSTSRAAAAA